MIVKCISVTATMSARGAEGLTPAMTRHIDGCNRCRDEFAMFTSLADRLGELRYVEFTAPRDTAQRVMAEIGPYAVPEPSGRSDYRIGIAAAAAVATAACGTAVLVRMYRHRAA